MLAEGDVKNAVGSWCFVGRDIVMYNEDLLSSHEWGLVTLGGSADWSGFLVWIQCKALYIGGRGCSRRMIRDISHNAHQQRHSEVCKNSMYYRIRL